MPQPPAVNVPQDAAAVDVIIDPRIELMTIVQYLSGNYEQRTNLITNFDFEYKREIEQHFRPFADHPAVATFSAMARLI